MTRVQKVRKVTASNEITETANRGKNSGRRGRGNSRGRDRGHGRSRTNQPVGSVKPSVNTIKKKKAKTDDRGQGKEKEPIETCTSSQEDEAEADYTETKSFESTPNVITILDDEVTTIHAL
ncbi:unnamed protein product [Rhizophagus irregularis]|nr:unnamed protein product [Rhizophagus irregularis]